MPSASSKTASMASQVPSLEGQDPLKVVVSMMEKKVRNLEKRKTRLVAYTQQVEEGKELIEKDQLDAVKKLEFVDHSLELAKEFHQIFKIMEQEHLKLQRKEQKRTKVELKEKSHAERHNLVVHILEVQSLLENLADEVKADFLNGTNGAIKLTEEDFVRLDGIYKLITPNQNEDIEDFREQMKVSSDHFHNLLDAKDKPVLNTTYKEIDAIISKVRSCKYFEKSEKEEEVKEEETVTETDAVVAEDREEQEIQPAAEEAGEDEEEATETAASEITEQQTETADVTEDSSRENQPQAQNFSEHNGVDLPSEFSEATTGSALNFMGESEFQPPVVSAEEGKLNAASPEFIPRSLQSSNAGDDQPAVSTGWEGDAADVVEDASADPFAWQDVPSSGENHQHHAGNRPRGGPRGRDRGGFRGGREGGRGGRGRGGYGQNGGSNFSRQDRQDNYQRREGGRGGPRGGSTRGGRGGPRGAPRGNAPRGDAPRGGFTRPQQQQEQ